MSIRFELDALELEKEEHTRELEQIIEELNVLYSKQKPLVEKEEQLKLRKSSLATRLLENVQNNLDSINKEIKDKEAQLIKVKNKLCDINDRIKVITTDFTLYIEEQASKMVSDFCEYVLSNLDEIGIQIHKSYQISEIEEVCSSRYGMYTIPTGFFAIHDKSNDSIIVKSVDFFFENDLYTLELGLHDSVVCIKTSWYKSYYDSFILAFERKLMDTKQLDEFFTVTFSKTDFTLELV